MRKLIAILIFVPLTWFLNDAPAQNIDNINPGADSRPADTAPLKHKAAPKPDTLYYTEVRILSAYTNDNPGVLVGSENGLVTRAETIRREGAIFRQIKTRNREVWQMLKANGEAVSDSAANVILSDMGATVTSGANGIIEVMVGQAEECDLSDTRGEKTHKKLYWLDSDGNISEQQTFCARKTDLFGDLAYYTPDDSLIYNYFCQSRKHPRQGFKDGEQKNKERLSDSQKKRKRNSREKEAREEGGKQNEHENLPMLNVPAEPLVQTHYCDVNNKEVTDFVALRNSLFKVMSLSVTDSITAHTNGLRNNDIVVQYGHYALNLNPNAINKPQKRDAFCKDWQRRTSIDSATAKRMVVCRIKNITQPKYELEEVADIKGIDSELGVKAVVRYLSGGQTQRLAKAVADNMSSERPILSKADVAMEYPENCLGKWRIIANNEKYPLRGTLTFNADGTFESELSDYGLLEYRPQNDTIILYEVKMKHRGEWGNNWLYFSPVSDLDKKFEYRDALGEYFNNQTKEQKLAFYKVKVIKYEKETAVTQRVNPIHQPLSDRVFALEIESETLSVLLGGGEKLTLKRDTEP